MFSVAELLDRAKAKANIESDYRLAKVLRITQSAVSNYRTGKYPNAEILEALCALSGDDPGVVVALCEADKVKEGPLKTMWMSVASRLQHGAASVSGVVALVMALGMFTMLLAADDAYAEQPPALLSYFDAGSPVYYVKFKRGLSAYVAGARPPRCGSSA